METDRHTHTQTDTQNDYRNPRCACAPRVNKQSKQSKVKIGQQVEVKYDDDVWYKGTLVEYDNATDEWVALFDEDGDQTKIKFPDEDVRML